MDFCRSRAKAYEQLLRTGDLADLSRNRKGRPREDDGSVELEVKEMVVLIRDGATAQVVAERFGITRNAVNLRLRKRGLSVTKIRQHKYEKIDGPETFRD